MKVLHFIENNTQGDILRLKGTGKKRNCHTYSLIKKLNCIVKLEKMFKIAYEKQPHIGKSGTAQIYIKTNLNVRKFTMTALTTIEDLNKSS